VKFTVKTPVTSPQIGPKTAKRGRATPRGHPSRSTGLGESRATHRRDKHSGGVVVPQFEIMPHLPIGGASDHTGIMARSIPSARATQTSLAFWTCAIITTISALVSAGFSVLGLSGPSGGDIFVRYAASRSIALLIAVLCCIGFRSREAIAALALVMSLVQGLDGLIGVLVHDPAKTYGPFVFALVNFAALVWLLRSHEEGHAEENSN
jgi:hypothetical protein